MFSFDIFSNDTARTEAALYACSACPWVCGWPPKDLPQADADPYGY